MYRNFGILAKEDVDLDEEMAATPTTDQEITVVDNQIINEQDGVRVAEIDQQTLNDFLDRDRRAHSSDSWPSEDRHYSVKQLFCVLLSDGIVVEFNTDYPEALVLQLSDGTEVALNFKINTSCITLIIAPVDIRAGYKRLSQIAASRFGIDVDLGKDFVVFISRPWYLSRYFKRIYEEHFALMKVSVGALVN